MSKDTPKLESRGNGIFTAPGARIIDRTGRKRLPIGDDGFTTAAKGSIVIDKTMLIADVLDSGYKATLFCRPRRFGKTLNMTMMRSFLEMPSPSQEDCSSVQSLFEGTDIWEYEQGRFRGEFARYPVVHISFNTVKKERWDSSFHEIKRLIRGEYDRHGYLASSDKLSDAERGFFNQIVSNQAEDFDYASSLIALTTMLAKHHGRGAVVLIDEYDAPVMAGFSNGYYDDVVHFLKGWLTGALKDGGEALAFACLTGVQRISKESIFSDLNNLVVNTALSAKFDERFGFTDAEVAALAAYLGHPDCMPEAREWYDGYRFGDADVYNPWSVINYFDQDCSPDVYWGNTSSNGVVGDLLRHADQATLAKVYRLLEPGGDVVSPLDLGVVFPDVGVRPGALWSMLYLAGYLTTPDTALPNNIMVPRRLRIPNHEVSILYRAEVVERFSAVAGGRDRLMGLHAALAAGDSAAATSELTAIFRDSASAFDLTSENGAHMLLLGLLFGMPGYGDPVSNREHGSGRPDIRVEPEHSPFPYGVRPLVTIELKFSRGTGEEELEGLARAGLRQIAERGYDEGPLPGEAVGRVRWGIACGGKRVVALAEKLG